MHMLKVFISFWSRIFYLLGLKIAPQILKNLKKVFLLSLFKTLQNKSHKDVMIGINGLYSHKKDNYLFKECT